MSAPLFSRVSERLRNLDPDHRALMSSTGWSLAVRLVGMGASFVVGVQLARRLEPSQFGQYGIVVAIALVLSVLGQFGLQTIATREISVAADRRKWGELRGYVSAFALVVLCASFALAMAWSVATLCLPQYLPRPSSLAGAWLVPLYALTVLIGAELRALGKIVTGQVMEILLRPLLMCIFLLLPTATVFKADSAVLLQVVTSAVTLLVCFLALAFFLPEPVRRTPAVPPRDWVRAASTLVSFDVLKQLDVTYGILLLGIFSTQAQAGYFRVALSTVVFVATPLSVMNVVLAPTLAQLNAAGESEKLQRIFTISAGLMLLAMVGAWLMIGIVGKDILIMLFGERYGPSWWPLLLLTAAQVINGFFGIGWVFLSMSGGERVLTSSLAVSVGISALVAIPLILIWGATGAAAASMVGALCQNLLVWRGVRSRSKLDSSALSVIRRGPCAA